MDGYIQISVNPFLLRILTNLLLDISGGVSTEQMIVKYQYKLV
jgi:hypothetical protein